MQTSLRAATNQVNDTSAHVSIVDIDNSGVVTPINNVQALKLTMLQQSDQSSQHAAFHSARTPGSGFAARHNFSVDYGKLPAGAMTARSNFSRADQTFSAQ